MAAVLVADDATEVVDRLVEAILVVTVTKVEPVVKAQVPVEVEAKAGKMALQQLL